MTGLAMPSPSRRAGGRLLALLVALLLAIGSLPGHAATSLDSGHGDCFNPWMQMADDARGDLTGDSADTHADSLSCSACSALARDVSLAFAEPAMPAVAPAVAFIERTPQPPRRPPRT